MKRILVNGAGGFIGGHLVKHLKAEGHWVRAVDLQTALKFLLSLRRMNSSLGDLRNHAGHA